MIALDAGLVYLLIAESLTVPYFPPGSRRTLGRSNTPSPRLRGNHRTVPNKS